MRQFNGSVEVEKRKVASKCLSDAKKRVEPKRIHYQGQNENIHPRDSKLDNASRRANLMSLVKVYSPMNGSKPVLKNQSSNNANSTITPSQFRVGISSDVLNRSDKNAVSKSRGSPIPTTGGLNGGRNNHLQSFSFLRTYFNQSNKGQRTLSNEKDKTEEMVFQTKDELGPNVLLDEESIPELPSKRHQQPLIKQFREEDYELGDLIGKGKFGSVLIARSLNTELIMAAKIMNKNSMIKYRCTKQLVREIRIHAMLDHPNIIRQYGVLQDSDDIYILMEYAPNGNLYNKLVDSGKFDEKTAAVYTKQVVSAFIYLQSKQILHRDLKPENILIDSDGQLKLADFGWSIQLAGNATLRQTFCGTLDYISPEMAQGEYYGLHTDNWSIGILIFELLTGELPFVRAGPFDMASTFGEIQFPDYLSAISKDFIGRLLTQDPLKRMTLREAVRHPFLTTSN